MSKKKKNTKVASAKEVEKQEMATNEAVSDDVTDIAETSAVEETTISEAMEMAESQDQLSAEESSPEIKIKLNADQVAYVFEPEVEEQWINDDGPGFLPEASEKDLQNEAKNSGDDLEGTELEGFESAQIEDLEMVEEERLDSILESILFEIGRAHV